MSYFDPNDESDYYEDINDIARSEGFSIDDDGHWVPLERDEDFYDYDSDDDDYDDYDDISSLV